MPLKPWYTVITPREDLRSGKPLDASEFAVHLDQVRDGSAASVYARPAEFFERTFLTQTLITLGSQVLRRLSGERTETSAVFNLMTQFGGGKTHALTLLYHLGQLGPAANHLTGVATLLRHAGISSVPLARTAAFVGTEFDSLSGRGGSDGTPLRKTPWGEIAYQLGGAGALERLAAHEANQTAPGGDVIRQILPTDQPCLILMDELLNYVSRNRRNGLGAQLYAFLQNLSETARGLPNVVIAVSIPRSEMEMTLEDHEDYDRFAKLLDRLGKAVMLSSESETAEIIRRRLFEWDLSALGQNGRVQIPREAIQTCTEYAAWAQEHRQQLPGDFPHDTGRDAFSATYPFHPTVLSVFERKWQALPRFQRTRGVLRLLALWVARSYQSGFNGAHRDPLIDLGTAPLEDSLFRAATFEQLGEARLEVAVTTDIVGKKDSHAVRLDDEAEATIRKARLHRKVATAIFFESNGGRSQNRASVPEIRLAIAAPTVEIANIETVLEALAPPNGVCYYLDNQRSRYQFSTQPNLTKILADRKAGIAAASIDERVQSAIQEVYKRQSGIEVVLFPTSNGQVPNQPILTLVVMSPDQLASDPATLARLEAITREAGQSARSYKSALIFVLAESGAALRDEARKALAWEAIDDEKDELPLEDSQRRQIEQHVRGARGDLREAVWRAYNQLAYLGRDNNLQQVDLGLLNSSAAKTPVELIVTRLKNSGEIEEQIGAAFLTRNWPAMTDWSTRAVRDAFFASPRFPRLLSGSAIRETIAKGVSNGYLAYASKTGDGRYQPFVFNTALQPADVEISEDTYILRREDAEAYVRRTTEPLRLAQISIVPPNSSVDPGEHVQFAANGADQHGNPYLLDAVAWSAASGSIDANGHYVAPAIPGSDTVTAQVDELTATSRVLIRGSMPVSAGQRGPSGAAAAEAREGSPQAPQEASRIVWSGEIPWQKWTNFYPKVLARFSASKRIRLHLRIEIEPDRGVSSQQVDEMRAGLRELGLSDDVRTE